MSLGVSMVPKTESIALIVLLLVFLVGVASVIPVELSGFFGICLVVIGTPIALLHKRIAQQIFGSSQSMPSFVSTLWRRIGEGGIQFLYFGIGIAFAVTGVFLLIRWARTN